MKLLAGVLGAVVAALVVKRVAFDRGFDLEKVIDRMPEGSLPKWMFGNIGAIRANTERIIELLETQSRTSEPDPS